MHRNTRSLLLKTVNVLYGSAYLVLLAAARTLKLAGATALITSSTKTTPTWMPSEPTYKASAQESHPFHLLHLHSERLHLLRQTGEYPSVLIRYTSADRERLVSDCLSEQWFILKPPYYSLTAIWKSSIHTSPPRRYTWTLSWLATALATEFMNVFVISRTSVLNSSWTCGSFLGW